MVLEKDEIKLLEGWKWAKLGDICHIASGSTPKTGVTEYWNGDICWVTPTDLGKLSNLEIFDSERKITKSGYDNSGTELIPPGSVVMSSRAPIGHLGIAKVSLCTNQGCKSFIPGPAVETLYLYYALKISVKALQTLGSGATFAEISKSQVEKFKIPLPPLPEQKRIAAILNEQMTAIDEARAASEARLEAARSLPAAYLRRVFPQQGQNLPEGWKWVQLGDICELNPKRPVLDRTDNKLTTFVQMSAVDARSGSIARPEVRPYTEIKKGYTYFAEGDVLFAKITPCMQNGKHAIATALIDGIGFGSTEFHVVRPSANIIAEWIHGYLRQPSVLVSATAHFTGAVGQQRVPDDYIASLKIPLPSLPEQKRIAAVLKEQITEAEKLIQSIENEIETIKSLPSALLRKAFKGEL